MAVTCRRHEPPGVKWANGFSSAAAAAGIKPDGTLDLALLSSQRGVRWAGTFTKNAAAAACIGWDRRLLGRPVRGIVVNSGNANACTGKKGSDAVVTTAKAAAGALGCSAEEVLVASTGTIGVPLQVELLVAALPSLPGSSSSDVASFSEAIMTTDTRPKVAAAAARDATIVGVAKGAAMLAPNMATMLAFVTTDADIAADAMQTALDRSVSRSFDRICVDACESTNDSVFLLSSGSVACDVQSFEDALERVCSSLAEQMVADAEGASRMVAVHVHGARDEDHAVRLGRAVASSPLWKAAVYGADPNWGRVVAALGATDRELVLDEIAVAIEGVLVFDGGEPTAEMDRARAAMQGPSFNLSCRVGTGVGSATILTTDLTPDYVTLNAFGTT